MKATWHGQIIAQSDDTVVVDNNHYFPPESLNMTFFQASPKQSFCGWKGQANYYHIVIGEDRNDDAAWYYPEPKAAAEEIRGRVAFWRGVEVSP